MIPRENDFLISLVAPAMNNVNVRIDESHFDGILILLTGPGCSFPINCIVRSFVGFELSRLWAIGMSLLWVFVI